MHLRAAIAAFFLLSGATGLVYQVVWVRLLGLVVGHSVVAVSVVVATFMAGLGIGARLAGAWASRVDRPLAAYGLLEIGIGFGALASPILFGALRTSGVGVTALGLPLGTAILLPPTLAMGATLPLLTRWYARDAASLGRDMGRLYALNTTGAVLGAGLAGFVLLPTLGQPATLGAAAAVNLAVGAGAVVLGRRIPLAPSRGSEPLPVDERVGASVPERSVLLAFALSGAAAMVDQVAWSRCFELFTGSTTYAFSLIVCAFIGGLAVGAHVVAQLIDRVRSPVPVIGALNLGIAAVSAALIPVLGELPVWLLGPLAEREGFLATQLFVFGVLVALLVLPTILMGGTYPASTLALTRSPESAPKVAGRAYAWNTAGAVLGATLAGLVFIPALGLQGTLWLAVGLNLLAAAVLFARDTKAASVLPALALLAALGSPGWNPRHMNLAPHMYAKQLANDSVALAKMRDSGSVVFHEEGLGATVSVFQRDDGARTMRINGKTDASSLADRLTQSVLGALPVLLADQSEDVFVLGLGSGMSLSAALAMGVERVQVAELLPEVVVAAERFSELLGAPLDDPRTTVTVGDGRHLLAREPGAYDVLVSQPTNLFVSGMSSLFTVESFETMRGAVRPGGVVAVWVQGYLIPKDDFRVVARTFREVFPEATLWSLSPFDFLLVARPGAAPVPSESAVAARLAGLRDTRVRRWSGLGKVEDLQRQYLLGVDGLKAWVGDGPVQRDRDPFLEFTAPRALYDPSLSVDPADLSKRRERWPGPSGSDARLAGQRRLDAAFLDGRLDALLAAQEADPEHPFLKERKALLMHGRALAMASSGEFQAAEAAAREVVSLEPDAFAGVRLLANILTVSGRVEEGTVLLATAVEKNRHNPYAHLAEAELMTLLGRTADAAAAMERARVLDPDLPELSDPG